MTLRVINGEDLLASLAAAQDALGQSPAGSQETWILPVGEFVLSQGLQLGAPEKSLHIQGQRAGDDRTTFTFGDGGPIAGDLIGLDLLGSRVSVDELRISARASGELTGIRARPTQSAQLSDIVLENLRGAAVTGLDVEAPTAHLTDIVILDVRAAETIVTGIRLAGTRLFVTRPRIERMVGAVRACGLEATADVALASSMVHVKDVGAARAEGLRLRVCDEGELSLLDIRAEGIDTPSDGGDAIGATLLSGGDVEVRGLSVENVHGARAMGVFAVAAGEIDWLAGDIRDVRGRSAGAAGVRLLASPSQKQLAIRDIQVEAIRANANGTRSRPPASWTNWVGEATTALVSGGVLPELPESGSPGHEEDVVGLHVGARVTEFETWVDHSDPGPVFVEQCVLRRVSGAALQVEGELRDVDIRGVEAWTSVRGGWVDGERVLLAQLTWHRHHTGIEFGPCGLTLANCLITGVDEGPGLIVPSDETDPYVALATFATEAETPLQPEPDPLPYVDEGPEDGVPPSVLGGALAPEAAVDLRLQPNHPLHREAQRVPGEAAATALFVGAHPPDTDSRCDLRDPLPPGTPAPAEQVAPSPVVDYRARDARSLTALMMDRARTVMPDWTESNPADMTTMFMELLANRLDHLAYKQENAVAEGFLGTALLRRSVEDHARLVDYVPDPGLSATAMLRFHIDDNGLNELNLRGRYDRGERLEIPQDTLVVNPDAEDTSVIFGTEAPLPLDCALDTLQLHEDIEPRATSAILQGDLTSLEIGRWLIIQALVPDSPAHVVRVTRVELGTDTTRIFWDPRRPTPTRYQIETTRIYGNVIPAHHGVRLTPSESQSSGGTGDPLEILRPWREQMRTTIDNRGGDVREIDLPLGPVSMRGHGWPFPDETKRQGIADLQVRVNSETWDRALDLSVHGPTDECYALRPGHGGAVALRFGDGQNGAALPKGQVAIEFSMRVGLGTVGNVSPDALTRILAFGKNGDIDTILGSNESDREEKVFRHLRVTNPISATGGRDPEPLERIRYRAPRELRNTLSAVVPSDYTRLLETLPEVAAARAVVVDAGIRHVVRVTLLLKDEDTLAGSVTDPDRDAERLRRWALARRYLESIRLLGFDVELVPPVFVPLDIDIVVDAETWAQADRLALKVKGALADNGGLFDPDVSGLGGDVHIDAIHRQVLSVDGVAAVRVRRLRRLEPDAVEYSEQGVLPIGSEEVAVIRNPYGQTSQDGLVTVTVCGGMS